MNEKFKNRYRIDSARHPHWDYGNPGAYFITICTHDRERYFGEIQNQTMKLSPLGAIADVLWYELKDRVEGIRLGEYVIMPDHIHVILIIENEISSSLEDQNGDIPTQRKSDHYLADNLPTMASISPKPQSVSFIIRQYKSAITRHANRLGLPFGWQPRFHDHIIRDSKSFDRISTYIQNNPANWQKERFRMN